MPAPVAAPPHVADLAEHPGYDRVFQPGRLTFGVIAPLEGYPDTPWPTLENHAEAVRRADQSELAAIWLRDVPFYDPGFGDAGQVVDPMVYAGWLAAQTKRIAIGTAGIVSPLRDPLFVAKQAASIDRLTGGRFLLGLATGDRPAEFAAFGQAIGDRAERYRDAVEVIRAVSRIDAVSVFSFASINDVEDYLVSADHEAIAASEALLAGEGSEWWTAVNYSVINRLIPEIPTKL
jgi:luciferase-type oxidoreductase